MTGSGAEAAWRQARSFARSSDRIVGAAFSVVGIAWIGFLWATSWWHMALGGFAVTVAFVAGRRRRGRPSQSAGLASTVREDSLHAIRSMAPTDRDALVIVGVHGFDELSDLHGFGYGRSLLECLVEEIDAVAPPRTGTFLVDDLIVIVLAGQHAVRGLTEEVKRIQCSLVDPAKMTNARLPVRVGCGFVRMDPADIELTYRRAHLAFLQTGAGQSTVEYHETLRSQVQRQLSLQQQIRRALAEDRMRFHAQPIVATRTGAPVALELLVRMAQPDGTLVSPADFLPECGRMGVLDEIGRRALTTAGHLLGRWSNDAALSEVGVNVNIAAQHIRQDLVNDVIRVCRRVPRADLLSLEFVEDELIDHQGSEMAHLHRLRMVGARLVLDDFGKGYSSLSYLQELPIDAVKFDGAFVDRFDPCREGGQLLPGLLHLVDSMGLDHTVEGVESGVMWSAMCRLGAEAVQGYAISRPFPLGDAETALRRLAAAVPRSCVTTADDVVGSQGRLMAS